MNIFEIGLTEEEIVFLRHATDHIQIQGKDAKFVATVQARLEHELAEIKELKKQAELEKAAELQKALTIDAAKSSGKKS